MEAANASLERANRAKQSAEAAYRFALTAKEDAHAAFDAAEEMASTDVHHLRKRRDRMAMQ